MLDRLARDAACSFVLTDTGRILRENDPDRSAGPRLALLGCRDGNLAFARDDVADDVAAAIGRIVAQAAPWFEADTSPACADALAGLLAPVTSMETSLVFALPHHGPVTGARIVRSGTPEGEALLARLGRDGVPPHLAEAGFVDVRDFWAPWCALMDQGEIAAMAFAARLGDTAAEIGVYTFPRWRGRAFAAAVTAAWSGHPGLRDRELFYSCLTSNASSRRVVARLGLEHIGMGLRIA